MPKLLPDSEEEDPEDVDCPELVQLEDGDHIFAISLLPPAAEIRAGSTILQCLAEAFKLNSEASVPPDHAIPDYLKEFENVFSKESFDTLPELKQWDHAIELIPGENKWNRSTKSWNNTSSCLSVRDRMTGLGYSP